MADLLGATTEDPRVATWRVCDFDAVDRLGDRRHHIRHHGRSHRPCQDAVDHDPGLFDFHRIVRAVASALAIHRRVLRHRLGLPAEFFRSLARSWLKACRTQRALSGLGHAADVFGGRQCRCGASSGWVCCNCARTGTVHNDWQWLFGIGILPALLSIIVMRRIREPDVVASRRRRREGGPQQIRLDRRTVRRSALAAQGHRGNDAGRLRRHWALGHRRLQQRPHAIVHWREL